MLENIDTPVATARVTWLAPEEGGRRSGPPAAPVYAANCTFPLGGEAATIPRWPATVEKFSLLLQKVGEQPDSTWLCNIDFFAPGLVASYLVAGAPMLVMEGPKVVGRALITEVFDDVLHDEGPS